MKEANVIWGMESANMKKPPETEISQTKALALPIPVWKLALAVAGPGLVVMLADTLDRM